MVYLYYGQVIKYLYNGYLRDEVENGIKDRYSRFVLIESIEFKELINLNSFLPVNANYVSEAKEIA